MLQKLVRGTFSQEEILKRDQSDKEELGWAHSRGTRCKVPEAAQSLTYQQDQRKVSVPRLNVGTEPKGGMDLGQE